MPSSSGAPQSLQPNFTPRQAFASREREREREDEVDLGDIRFEDGAASHEHLLTQGASLPQIFEKYQPEIQKAFEFYVNFGYAGKNRHTMDAHSFTKFVKDANLCNISPGHPVHHSSSINSRLPAPELLWMMVLKKMDPHANLAYESKSKREIGLQQFNTALEVLAVEHFKHREEYSPAQKLELLLIVNVIPGAKYRMEEAEKVHVGEENSNKKAVDFNALMDTLPQYQSPTIKKLLTQYEKEIKYKFQHYAQRHMTKDGQKRRLLIFAAMLEMAKDHNLLPFINKNSLRSLFNGVCEHAQSEEVTKQAKLEAKEPDMSYGKFIVLLKLMSEFIYGSKLYAQTYNTPDLRFDKLFSKLFFLEGGNQFHSGRAY